MRVLQTHNYYTKPGGEDTVVAQESKLLKDHGHTAETFFVTNDDLVESGLLEQSRLALNTIWSRQSARAFADTLRTFAPDVIHVHNTFTKLSPSIYWVASRFNIPVVQTFHNYRVTCANGLLMRDGKPCQDCVGKVFPWPALQHRCYRDSLAATGVVTALQTFHRLLGSYHSIGAYIVLTHFAKGMLEQAGFQPDKLHVKPNFVEDPGPVQNKRQRQCVFVGRIAEEKGVDLVLGAWERVASPEDTLVIVGDGSDKPQLQQTYQHLTNVSWLGWRDRSEVLQVMSQSRFLVMASRWYEGFPMVLVEALSLGTPLIGPNHGSVAEIITGDRGLLFQAGSVAQLAATLKQALDSDEATWLAWHRQTRLAYETLYSPEVNYAQLVAIYEGVLHRQARGSYEKT
jgi:glycosyltransferase involved in cell wall biosynthesis